MYSSQPPTQENISLCGKVIRASYSIKVLKPPKQELGVSNARVVTETENRSELTRQRNLGAGTRIVCQRPHESAWYSTGS